LIHAKIAELPERQIRHYLPWLSGGVMGGSDMDGNFPGCASRFSGVESHWPVSASNLCVTTNCRPASREVSVPTSSPKSSGENYVNKSFQFTIFKVYSFCC
jgi:hypothetical protein